MPNNLDMGLENSESVGSFHIIYIEAYILRTAVQMHFIFI